MRDRSTLIIYLGVFFFIIGGLIGFVLFDGEDKNETDCWERGGVPAEAANGYGVICIAPEALQP